jgi:hypothetical protein
VSERRIRSIEIDEIVVHGKRAEKRAIAAAIEQAVLRAAAAEVGGVSRAAGAAAEAVERATAPRSR